MLSPLTGIIFPYFFLNIKNPFNGYFNNILTLFAGASSAKDWFGTSHSNILPSVPRDKILKLVYDLPGGLKAHQLI